MTTLTPEPTPPLRSLVAPFVILLGSIYLLFTALVMQVYVLLPIAAILFAIAAVPGVRLLRHR